MDLQQQFQLMNQAEGRVQLQGQILYKEKVVKNDEHKNKQSMNLQGYEQQFLEINEDIKKKLDSIGKQNTSEAFTKQSIPNNITQQKEQIQQRNNPSVKPTIKKHTRHLSLSSSIQSKQQQSGPHVQLKESKSQKRLEAKQSQSQIKKDYVQKMKQWQKQKEELAHKKQVLQNYKLKQKQQRQQRLRKEQNEEAEFYKLQKKKQLQQKIQEIEERRKQREEALKNAVLKRSYNGVPKYLEYQQKFKAQEEKKITINMKLIKDKKIQKAIDPETLKAHQQAYIQRIKQRLNMSPQKQNFKSPKDASKRQTSSDFNLYLKRSQELKKAELDKIIRRKKFQQKISKIPVKIDEEKKQEILISKDKAKNPRKYHILSQKALNDQQIYQQFKGLEIQLDPKSKGNEYLRELKKSPKDHKRQIQEQKNKQSYSYDKTIESKNSSFPKIGKSHPDIINNQKSIVNPENNLKNRGKTQLLQKGPSNFQERSKVQARLTSDIRSQRGHTMKSRSLSQMSSSKSYEFTLQKAKERDSKYMNVLRQKLALLD